jgi:BASS family bile acid:Na+ symporter
MVTGLLVNMEAILGVIGTGGILAALIFLVVAFVLAYFMGGSDPGVRSVLGLGTAQRNLSATLVVAGANFASDPDVIVIAPGGIIGFDWILLELGVFADMAGYFGSYRHRESVPYGDQIP